MTVALWSLLGFVLWTMAVLAFGLGLMRFDAVRRGEIRAIDFRSETPQLGPRYQRVHRAHLNCLETLPMFAAVVLVGHVVGVRGWAFDAQAVALLAMRVVQTIAHVWAMDGAAAYVRIAAFFVQPLCVLGMIGVIILSAS